ncbi:basic blue protein-like isoform X1 [Solanum tuberosum]|uniref:basic blue protein-like isoform X1 n=1 Tax=Solanum tuberosum TaxID=4113 RepID=UPI00073A449C|nr:PREDICTED: basic blue protein-like isoform X1 [Solanum tuberosum]
MGARDLLVVAIVFTAAAAAVAGDPVHHVVGEDRGWDPSTDVASWYSQRVFRVGDKIWFTYSTTQESLVELRNEEDFTSCDLSNPIKMYTDGLDTISLEGEGIRYFVSGNTESCKNGLKIPVKIQPKEQIMAQNNVGSMAVADGPTVPSASTNLNGLSYILIVGLSICLLGL